MKNIAAEGITRLSTLVLLGFVQILSNTPKSLYLLGYLFTNINFTKKYMFLVVINFSMYYLYN